MIEKPQYLIIPAAGLGKRMRDVHPGMSKEMLPIGDKPAIAYAVEEGLSAGISDIVIILSRRKEDVRRYLEDSFKSAYDPLPTFDFLYQKEPRGEADAISLAKEFVGDHAAAIVYPDNIYFPPPGALKILKQVFLDRKTDVVALMEVNASNAEGLGNSGKVDLEPLGDGLFRIKKFHPKGSGSYPLTSVRELRTCGISISGPHLLDYIEKAREVTGDEEFIDLHFREIMIGERELLGCLLPGTVFDIGNPKGYEQCLKYLQTPPAFPSFI
ncbi:MAG: sugar phosphate nucleotidyltransferase [Nitrospirota bacterium]